jgi:hypothetical protein
MREVDTRSIPLESRWNFFYQNYAFVVGFLQYFLVSDWNTMLN